MRTKIVGLFTLLLFTLSSVPGLIAAPTNYIYMNGTGSSYDYFKTPDNPNDDKNTGFTRFEEQLNDAYTLFGNATGGQVVVGHSQGGMRAVAYAAKMKEQGKSSNLNAVIAVAGPVQGFTPLAQGSKVLEANCQKMADKLIRGTYAVAAVTPIIGTFMPAFFVASFFPGQSLSAILKVFKVQSNDRSMQNVLAFLDDGQITGEGRFCSSEVLSDFNPQSPYVDRYLSGTTTTSRWVEVKDGIKWVRTWGIFGYWTTAYKNVLIYERHPNAYKPIPDTVSVGYIYGTDRDPINMATAGGSRSEIDKYFTYYKVATAAAGVANSGLYLSYAVIAGTFWWNPLVWIPAAALSVSHAVLAANAATANGIASNFPTSWNRDILCTTSSDAFIPVEAATRPLSQSGGQAIDLITGVYFKDFPDNHASELTDTRIWGSDGYGAGELRSPATGGKIQEWLSSRGNWNPAFRKDTAPDAWKLNHNEGM